MINDYLLKIADYIQSHKLPFKRINISFNILPKAFYETIINYFKQIVNYDDTVKIKGFDICFDKNNKAYISVIGNNGKTKINIISDYYLYENLPASKIIKASEFEKRLKQTDEQINNSYLNNLSDEFKIRFLSNTPESKIEFILGKSFNVIFEYIKFLEKEFKNNIEKISFKESEWAKTHSHREKNNSSDTRERKNDEISIDERNKVLSKYNSVYEFQAISDKKTIYHVKLFKVSNKKYKLILEPDEATKYTKIVHIDSKSISKAETKSVAIQALQESRASLTARDDITRHQHTTLKAYKALMEYLLKSENNKEDNLNGEIHKSHKI